MAFSLSSYFGSDVSNASTQPKSRIRHAPVRAISTIIWDNGSRRSYGQVDDIQADQCLIKTESTIQIGTRIGLEITVIGLNRTEKYEIAGQILSEQKIDGRRAYNVEFVLNTDADKTVVEQFRSELRR